MSNELFSLTGKVAVLTGATGHLGKSMAKGLAQAGAQVIMVSRTAKKLEDIRADFDNQGLETIVFEADITQEKDILQLKNFIENQYGHLDILVNNAHHGRASPWQHATKEDFLRDYGTAVVAPFQLIQSFVEHMKSDASQKSMSAIVNIATMYAHVSPDPRVYGDSGMNNPPYYGAAKSGLVQMTRYLACHFGSMGIRVNSISPGPFPPRSVIENNPEFAEQLKQKVPLERLGNPSDLIGALVFLCADASNYITGIDLAVDGGWTAW